MLCDIILSAYCATSQDLIVVEHELFERLEGLSHQVPRSYELYLGKPLNNNKQRYFWLLT